MRLSRTLTARIMWQFFVALVVATVFVALFMFYSIERYVDTQAQINLSNRAEIIELSVEQSFNGIVDDLKFISKTPPIQAIVQLSLQADKSHQQVLELNAWKKRLQVIFSSMLSANKNYTQMRFISRADNGRELVRVNQTVRGIYAVHDSALQQKGHRLYFRNGINLSEGSFSFSNIEYNTERGRLEYPLVLTFRAMAPVHSYMHEVFGLLVINVNLAHLLKELLSKSSGQYAVLLYDKFGNVLIYNQDKKTLQFLPEGEPYPETELNFENVKSNSQLIKKLTEGSSYISEKRSIVSAAGGGSKMMTMVVALPKDKIVTHEYALAALVIAGAFVLNLVVMLFVYYAVRRIIGPVSGLVKKMKGLNYLEIGVDPSASHKKDEAYLVDVVDALVMRVDNASNLDSLTAMSNRVAFIRYLEELSRRSLSGGGAFGLLQLSINHFKESNATYGYDFNDELLMQFSQKLMQLAKRRDDCGRIASNRFALLMHLEVDAQDHIRRILDRIESELNQTYVVNGVVVNVLVSGGFAVCPADAHDCAALLQLTESALAQSKELDNGEFVIAEARRSD